MVKEYPRKNKAPLVMIQFRVTAEQRRQILMLAAELGLSIQGLMRRLIAGSFKGSGYELERKD